MIDRRLSSPSTEQIHNELVKAGGEGLRLAGLRHKREGLEHFLHIIFDETEGQSEQPKYEVVEVAANPLATEPIIVCDSGKRGVDLAVRRERTTIGQEVILL